MSESFSLEGKVALVTGGGTGLERGITEAYLAAGARRVYIVSRKAAAIEAAAAEMDPAGRCVAIPADLSDMDACRALASEIGAREPRLDILVNNSGAGWSAPFDSFPEKGWDKVFELNLKAPFFLIQAMADLLKAAGTSEDPARVVNIESIAGEMGKGPQPIPMGFPRAPFTI